MDGEFLQPAKLFPKKTAVRNYPLRLKFNKEEMLLQQIHLHCF